MHGPINVETKVILFKNVVSGIKIAAARTQG
jgi:hypothetical protein